MKKKWLTKEEQDLLTLKHWKRLSTDVKIKWLEEALIFGNKKDPKKFS